MPPALSLQIPEDRPAGGSPADQGAEDDSDDDGLDLEGDNEENEEDNAGVHKAEATQEVFERSSKKLLLLGCAFSLRWCGLWADWGCRIGLACYIHSLDSTSLYTFPTFAASSFHAHGLLGAIGVAQAVVRESCAAIILSVPG